MVKYSYILALVVLFSGCGSDNERDGSQGPSLSSSYSSSSVQIESVKRFNTEGVAVDIALSEDGRIVYIASGDGGLEVIDVSSPEYPHLIYSYDLPEYVNYVEVEDGVVYVAYVPEGLQSYSSVHTFDVYYPYNPYYIGSSQGNSGVGHSSVVHGDYYYEVNSKGLELFRSYDKVGSYYLHDSAYALALHNNYIFIANGRVGLTILKTNIGGKVATVR